MPLITERSACPKLLAAQGALAGEAARAGQQPSRQPLAALSMLAALSRRCSGSGKEAGPAALLATTAAAAVRPLPPELPAELPQLAAAAKGLLLAQSSQLSESKLLRGLKPAVLQSSLPLLEADWRSSTEVGSVLAPISSLLSVPAEGCLLPAAAVQLLRGRVGRPAWMRSASA